MKIKNASIMPVTLFCLALTSCISTVPAGYRGIKVYLLGNKKGVDEKQLGVGAYFLGFNQRVYTFPVFQQNYIWKDETSTDGPDNSINFQSKEGLDVKGDFGISYSIIPDSVSTIFQKYRRGIEEITNIFLRNMVRDALNTTASRMPIESIYGVHKRDLLLKVDSMVGLQTKRYGITIDRIYTIGELHLPASIEAAINAKLEANQRSQQAQNEVKAAEAEAAKKVASSRGAAESQIIAAKAESESTIIEAKAQAEITKIKADAEANAIRVVAESQAQANLKLSQSINKDWIQYKSVEKWDGKLPQVAGQSLPYMPLPLPNK